MSEIRWKLKETLEARGVSTYRLAQKLQGRVGRNTVHAAARGDAGGVQFDTLAAILDGITELTGKPVQLADVLEVVESNPETPEARQARARALSLLTGTPWGKKPEGSTTPVEVKGPPIEELLKEHRGPEL